MFAGEVEVGGWIGGDDALSTKPRKKALDAAEASNLRVDDEGFITAWGSVVMEIMLVIAEVIAGELVDLAVRVD